MFDAKCGNRALRVLKFLIAAVETVDRAESKSMNQTNFLLFLEHHTIPKSWDANSGANVF